VGLLLAVSLLAAQVLPTQNALCISDIHFDPVADATLLPKLIDAPISQWDAIFMSSQSGYSNYNSDTNYPLMMSALKEAKARAPFGYVLCTGDLLRHRLEDAFVSAGGTKAQFPAFGTKTALFVLDKLQKTFPVPVVYALGNNDTVYGDYTVPPSNGFLKSLSGVLKTLTPSQMGTFRFGGYYSFANPSTPNHDFLSLNTVFWSPSYKRGIPPKRGPIIDPGGSEMGWLGAKLADARKAGRKVSLLMHIPPGMDAFGSSTSGTSTMWVPKYAQQFNDLVSKYSDVLQTSFAGHTHMDDFRVMTSTAGDPLLVIHNTPAVSPDFGNNPGFSFYTFMVNDGAILDFQTFFIQLADQNPLWQREYRFSTTYGANAYTGTNLLQIVALIRQQGAIYDAYSNLYDASASPSPVTSSNWMYYTCAQTEFTSDGYNNCVQSLK
jgi:sphingomyelin phosphodiesterase acid-like 3